MNTFNTRFVGFEHDATELSAYIFSIDTFIISLKSKEIVRFVTTDPEDFQQWLEAHHVRNVNETLGRWCMIIISRKSSHIYILPDTVLLFIGDSCLQAGR